MHLARNILKGKKMSKQELRKQAREELAEAKAGNKGKKKMSPKDMALKTMCA